MSVGVSGHLDERKHTHTLTHTLKHIFVRGRKLGNRKGPLIYGKHTLLLLAYFLSSFENMSIGQFLSTWRARLAYAHNSRFRSSQLVSYLSNQRKLIFSKITLIRSTGKKR